MRAFLIAGLALGLTACATMAPEGRVQSDEALEAYKVFNASCDRQYGWPFTFAITCRAQRSVDEIKAQAAAIAEAVKQAVKEAMAEASATP